MERHRLEIPKRKLSDLFSLVIGLPFMANPQLIGQYIIGDRYRNCYNSWLKTGNEEDAKQGLKQVIPDGEEQLVGGAITNALEIAEMQGRIKRRRLDTKTSGKLHSVIVDTVRDLINVYNSGRSIRSRR